MCQYGHRLRTGVEGLWRYLRVPAQFSNLGGTSTKRTPKTDPENRPQKRTPKFVTPKFVTPKTDPKILPQKLTPKTDPKIRPQKQTQNSSPKTDPKTDLKLRPQKQTPKFVPQKTDPKIHHPKNRPQIFITPKTDPIKRVNNLQLKTWLNTTYQKIYKHIICIEQMVQCR